ncbi:Protein of unknown function [Actinacidiphila yanglinensis]|uniref:DUF742 domain-containing protein n=1 Tax=Actinacidiphila yanglinensis TaxID=310779 RepID=A0A1H5VPZ2_9ACTN|nr:DUF742 domain-containing protein [Actinacidiphila yanglinensis]SEF89395.1 Protein of unknown function [Actinacidiphila yanglinensis]
MSGPRRDPDVVRPYVRTGGRSRPSRDVRLETLVIAADSPLQGLEPDARRVFAVCRGGVLAVAEIAAGLELPASVVRILVSGLMDSGHLAAPVRRSRADAPTTDLLKEVLHGLRSIA